MTLPIKDGDIVEYVGRQYTVGTEAQAAAERRRIGYLLEAVPPRARKPRRSGGVRTGRSVGPDDVFPTPEVAVRRFREHGWLLFDYRPVRLPDGPLPDDLPWDNSLARSRGDIVQWEHLSYQAVWIGRPRTRRPRTFLTRMMRRALVLSRGYEWVRAVMDDPEERRDYLDVILRDFRRHPAKYR